SPCRGRRFKGISGLLGIQVLLFVHGAHNQLQESWLNAREEIDAQARRPVRPSTCIPPGWCRSTEETLFLVPLYVAPGPREPESVRYRHFRNRTKAYTICFQ